MVTIDKHGLHDTINDAATRFVNQAAPGLPAICWTYRDDGTLAGHFGEYEYDDPEAVAQQWVKALGLTEADEDSAIRVFAGSNGGLKIEVWYVTDRDEFERK